MGLVALSNNSRNISSCPTSAEVRQSVPKIEGQETELSGADCTRDKLQEAINNFSKVKLVCNDISISSQVVVNVDKKVHIIGAKPSGKTVLNGNGTKRILFTRGSSVTVVENLEFKNGKSESTQFAPNPPEKNAGGALIYAYPLDTITIDRNIFLGNTLDTDFKNDSLGGGLRTGNGDTKITNSVFIENISKARGGGLWKGEKGKGVFENNLFWENFTYNGTLNLTTAPRI